MHHIVAYLGAHRDSRHKDKQQHSHDVGHPVVRVSHCAFDGQPHQKHQRAGRGYHRHAFAVGVVQLALDLVALRPFQPAAHQHFIKFMHTFWYACHSLLLSFDLLAALRSL